MVNHRSVIAHGWKFWQTLCGGRETLGQCLVVLYFHIGWLHTHYFTDLQNQKLGKHHLMLRSTSGAEGRGVVRGTFHGFAKIKIGQLSSYAQEHWWGWGAGAVRGTLGITRVDGNIGEILSINGTGVSWLSGGNTKITVREKGNGSGIIRRSSGKRTKSLYWKFWLP